MSLKDLALSISLLSSILVVEVVQDVEVGILVGTEVEVRWRGTEVEFRERVVGIDVALRVVGVVIVGAVVVGVVVVGIVVAGVVFV